MLKLVKSYHAFSILELMITVVIIAILACIATIPFTTLIAKNNVVAGCNQIVAALQLTRSEAITRNTKVVFCKSKDHKTCSGDWSDGQIIVANNAVIRIFYPQGHAKLIWNSSLGKDDAVTFLSTGTTDGQQGTFYYCPEQAKEHGMAIILEQTGRIRIASTTYCKS